jgi:SAM-dependent methyltransferase
MTWLQACPARFRTALQRCARGDAPPNVVVMQLHADATSDSEVATVLADATEACRAEESASTDVAGRLAAALAIARSHPGAFTTVKTVLGGLEHGGTAATPDDGVAHWAAAFDDAVERSAEGSVALYALGDADLLRAATDEVVAMLRGERFLGTDRDVLDVGCGIGRFERALAAGVRSVVGIDISPRMIEAARRRCAGLPNVAFLLCSGRDLAPFADASFDLVLAVDAFPYLVQSGMTLAETHVSEAARVLRPGGHLSILNFSYRGDDALDRADVARLATGSGLQLVRAGTRGLRVWDGLAFDLVRNAAP